MKSFKELISIMHDVLYTEPYMIVPKVSRRFIYNNGITKKEVNHPKSKLIFKNKFLDEK